MRNQGELEARGDVLVQRIERFEQESGRWPASFDELLQGSEREELLATGVEGREWTYRAGNDGFAISIGNGSAGSDRYCLSYASTRGSWYHDY